MLSEVCECSEATNTTKNIEWLLIAVHATTCVYFGVHIPQFKFAVWSPNSATKIKIRNFLGLQIRLETIIRSFEKALRCRSTLG